VDARDPGAERGVELASHTDDLNLQAEALIELADVAYGTPRATAALEQALEIAERKDNVVLVRQIRGRRES